VGRWRRRWQEACAELTSLESSEPEQFQEAVRGILSDRPRCGRPRKVRRSPRQAPTAIAPGERVIRFRGILGPPLPLSSQRAVGPGRGNLIPSAGLSRQSAVWYMMNFQARQRNAGESPRAESTIVPMEHD
jgi:hypothetical protein